METKPGDHKTYKVIKDYKKTQKSYTISEYYLSGNLKSEGIYSDNNGKIKEGFFTDYYESGKVKSRTLYTENIAYGDFVSWHENGNKKLEGEYIVDNYSKPVRSDLKIKNTWDENNTPGVVNGNGNYYEILPLESSRGEVKNGKKTDLWQGITKVGNLTFKETYQNGKLTEGISTDSLNNTYKYKKIEEKAQPKNGMPLFYKTFASKVSIPEVKEDVKEIKIMLSFIIDKDGKISEIKTIKSYDAKTDETFVKTLSKSGDWFPAYHRGRVFKSQFTLPITIQINQGETQLPKASHTSR
jgi:antitoxin component YwqK of YwqJK toxin-antitoxin module